MSICLNCKIKVNVEDIFCPHCGFSLLTTAKVENAKKFIEKEIDMNVTAKKNTKGYLLKLKA